MNFHSLFWCCLVEISNFVEARVQSNHILLCYEPDFVMQKSSQVCSEKADHLEISSELKSNGSLEVQSKLQDDGNEKCDSNMIEVQDLKSGSENYDVIRDSDELLVEKPNETGIID